MLRLLLLTVILCLSVPQISQAGFEWLPPQEEPMQKGAHAFDFDVTPPPVANRAPTQMVTPAYQSPKAAPMPLTRTPSPIANAYSSGAYGSQDSMSSAMSSHSNRAVSTAAGGIGQSMSSYKITSPNTGRMTAPVYTQHSTLTTARQTRPAPIQQRQAQQAQPVSLRIDPFPLGNQSTNAQSREIRPTSVEQAMMEISRNVTPMPLGKNMQTGAQVAYTNQPTVTTPINNPITGMAPQSLTPVGVMGGIQSGKMAPIKTRNFTKIEGFGSDLPLALALSQVLPNGFNHSFALGVDPGTTVSWQGGKAWNDVLQDMLRPQGLMAAIKNDAVIIQPL